MNEDSAKTQIAALMAKAHIPGMSFAYIHNGKIQLIALGVTDASSKPSVTVNPNTVFRAASLSKPIFAYMVLKLIQQGRLKLDQSLNDILEDKRLSEVKFRTLLTPELVLSHRTGLPGNDPIYKFLFEPGSEFAYSGAAYYYLQQVIEKQTKSTLEQLAKELVFDPLHMTHSSFHPPEKAIIAVGHDENMKPQPLPEKGPAYAPYTLHTTANDYALFMAELMRDENLKDETLKKAFEPTIFMTKDKWAQQKIAIEDLKKIAWGLGWGLQIIGDEKIAFHWGDVGDSKGLAVMNVKNKTGMVYFANSQNGLSIAHELIALCPDLKDLTPALNYVFGKYGYQRHTEPGWEVRQRQQTWHNLLQYELNDKPAWLADLQKNNLLIIDLSQKQTLSFKCSPDSLFYKLIMNELDIFKDENKMDDMDDCNVKTQPAEQNMASLTIHIQDTGLYNKFIAKLNAVQLLPTQTNTPQDTQTKSGFPPTPFSIEPKPK